MLSVRKLSVKVQQRTYCRAVEYNKRLVARAQEGVPSSSLRDIDSDIHKILSEMSANNVQFNAETNEILLKISQGTYSQFSFWLIHD